ncbi:MAG TPA: FtsX-like permease family protein [Kineosporiaceae bacterium]|nr:FtsX-like permease family protein [Kineosporiaceae bacterium]
MRSHRLRFLLTAVAVMLGVSLVSGTYVLTDSLNGTFDAIVDQSSVGTDVQVRGVTSDTKTFDGTELRAPLPVTMADQLKQVDGVSRAVPDLQGSAVLVGKDGTAVRSGGAPAIGLAFRPDDPVIKLVKGRDPQNKSEVAVESATLKRANLQVGAQTKALIGNTPESVTIVGEVSFGAGLAGATLVFLDPKTAESTFAPDGTVQTITLTAAPGISEDQLRTRVAATLPANAEAITGTQLNADTKEQIGKMLRFIPIFLLVFAGVSLFVGGFIIANTFSMLVAQRTRELALLRAIGASRSQVLRVVLGEASVLGLVGSLLGLGAGILLAAGLMALFDALGLEISGGLPVHTRTVVVSLLVGIIVTVVSAVLPAVRASRVAPVAAMRDDVAAPVGGVRTRGFIGVVFVILGFSLLIPGVTQDDVKWLLVGIGAGSIVIGSLIAAPATTRPVIRVVASPFVLIAGTIGRLARENSLRNPRRTATTASALMIGLALMAAVSVIASSTKASVADIVESQLTADYVLDGGNAPFPVTVAEKVSTLPDVASVATLGGVQVVVDKQAVFAMAADAQGIADNVKVDVTSGSLNALDSGQVLVSKKLAEDRGWKVGTVLNAGIGTVKQQSLTIGGVFDDNQVLATMVVPRKLYTTVVPPALQGDFSVYVKAKPGVDQAALRNELTSTVKPFVVVSVMDGDEFTNSQADQVNVLLYTIYLLLALSVVIAVLGIVNTLALSVFERTREIGLLRAVGMTRRQLRRMITVESISTAVFGAVLGTLLGLVLGITVQYGSRSEGLDVLSIPWLSLFIVLIAAALAGLVAAVLPAWRAVRLDVLRAITAD